MQRSLENHAYEYQAPGIGSIKQYYKTVFLIH